jgi:predicted secreted Zn-dependent protease
MFRACGLFALAVLVLAAISCSTLAQARRPAFVVTDPVAIQNETTQDGIVRLVTGVWRRTYEVPGTNAGEIRHNLDDLRRTTGHEDFNAETKWDLRWSMRYSAGKDGGCHLVAVTLEYYAVVTLPALVDETSLAAEEAGNWRSFADALEEHEMGHVDREAAGAAALQQALLGLGPQSDCATLANLVTAMGEQAKTSIRVTDELYDAETEHGASQGALFR